MNARGNITDPDNHGKPEGNDSDYSPQTGASAIETGANRTRVGLDFETLPAEELWTSARGSFVRLVGAGPAGNVTVTPETALCGSLTASGDLVGHNLAGFDLLAAERHLGIPVENTAPRMHDLRLVAFQADPPHSAQTKPGPGFKSYSLDALADRHLGGAKSTDGKALAREFGGWGSIPTDDPRFVEYCRDDVELALRLAEVLPMTDYDRREARVASVTSRATLEGFRVDVDALKIRVRELEDRSAAGREMLADTYGFPLTNRAGKPSKAPQRTSQGKQAFRGALESLGFPTGSWPLSKDGSLSLSKETITKALEWADDRSHPAADVIRAVQGMNGVRNNAANLLRCTADGRVHPLFAPFQATGRWSVQEPGLTVLKKSGGDSERAFLLPEEGHVLVSIDLDQVDIRCVAAHSQDPNLIAIVNDPDRDIHSEVAVMAFGSAEGKHRFHAKSIDLGWLYGRTVNGLSRTPGITRDAAERVDASMRHQFARVMDWQSEVRGRASSGALLDNGFGRRLRCEPGQEFTQAPAMMGQSTTRDLIAEGLLDLRNRAPEMLPMLRVIVHDEIVASVPEDHAEECARILQDCMSREWAPAGASRPVRFTAGQGKPFVFGRNWLECYG